MIDKVQYMYKMDMPAYKILVKKFNGEQPLMKYSVKTLQQRLKKTVFNQAGRSVCSVKLHTKTCLQLEVWAHAEKITFLKGNGICFACLCMRHISKYC